MDRLAAKRVRWLRAALTTLTLALAAIGCARLPYTTTILHEDARVRVIAQHEVDPAGYTHPLQLSQAEIASILRGFSVREQQRLPLRWFAEELPPKPLFRSDEIMLLAPYLSESFTRVGADERVHFEVSAPGINPSVRKDLLSGWLATRDPYLYLTIEYFHEQIPTRSSDLYDYNYPTPPPTPKQYLLYFEPGRFWVTDAKGRRALEVRQFLKSAEATAPAERPAQ
jgi:hypothetical protein